MTTLGDRFHKLTFAAAASEAPLTARERRMAHALATMETMLVSRSRLQAGPSTFDGDRETYDNLGYLKSINAAQYFQRFKRDGLAKRVVKAFPDATWRGEGGELVEDEDPNVVTAFEAAWFAFSDKMKVWTQFRKTDTLAGVARFAVLLKGLPGDLDKPAPTSYKPEEVFFLYPYSENDVTIQQYEADVKNPRYGRPTMYKINMVAPSAVATNGAQTASELPTSSKDVHWTRVLHVADTLENAVFGTPRLESVWNYLDDLDKVRGGGSEAFWQRILPPTFLDLDNETRFGPGEEDKFAEEIEDMMNGLKRWAQTRGVTPHYMQVTAANFNTNVDALIALVASGSEIPQRILMGSERGNLASEQDRENWAERVQDRRQEYAGPMIVKPFVDELIAAGVLPTPKQYKVEWPTLHDLSDTEKAKLALMMAQTNMAQQSQQDPANKLVFLPNEIRDAVGYEPLPDDFADQQRELVKEAAAARAKAQPVGPEGKPVPPNARPKPVAAETAEVRKEASKYRLLPSLKKLTWLQNGRKANKG